MKRVIIGSLLGVMLLVFAGCSTVTNTSKGLAKGAADDAAALWDGIKNLDSWFQEHAW